MPISGEIIIYATCNKCGCQHTLKSDDIHDDFSMVLEENEWACDSRGSEAFCPGCAEKDA